MVNLSQWMGMIKDDTPLSSLSIPGTHQSTCRKQTIPLFDMGNFSPDFVAYQYDERDVPY